MWNRPHIIVLDEPTNYLDREALGALTQAIKAFSGGVIIISHNAEFTDAICTEKWLVADGLCVVQGGIDEDADVGGKVKVLSEKSIKKSRSAGSLKEKAVPDDAGGNTNKSINSEIILNPKTLYQLSKKEVRLLTRQSEIAGKTLKEYVATLTCKSPEWQWL